MKKLLALMLAACMVFALCGTANAADGVEIAPGSNKSASGSTDKDVMLDFWCIWPETNARAKYFIEKLDEFSKIYEEETGISVEAKYVAWDGYEGLIDKTLAGAVSGETPVLSLAGAQLIRNVYPLATDLSKLLSQETIDNYMDSLLNTGCYQDGKLVAVPGGRSYMCLLVNKNLVEQSGHTLDELDTWDGVHEVSKDIAALGDDIEGFGIFWDSDAWGWESMVYSYGGYIDNEDGTVVTFADTPAGAAPIKLVREMLEDGSCYSYYGESTDLEALTEKLVTGKLGMRDASINSYGSCKEMIEKNGYDVELVLLPQPKGEGCQEDWVGNGGSNIMILENATDTQKQVAAAFLTYLAQDENVAEWNNTSAYLAYTKSVYDSEAYKEVLKDPNMAAIRDNLQNLHVRPNNTHWREMYKHIYADLEYFTMHFEEYDDAKIDEMVNGWQEYCQQIIDEDA